MLLCHSGPRAGIHEGIRSKVDSGSGAGMTSLNTNGLIEKKKPAANAAGFLEMVIIYFNRFTSFSPCSALKNARGFSMTDVRFIFGVRSFGVRVRRALYRDCFADWSLRV